MRRTAAIGSLILVGLALAQGPAQSVHRDSFEGTAVKFRPGPATVQHREEAHAITQQFAHSAPTSEYLRVTSEESGRELNPYVHYVYPTPTAPVIDETAANLWLRATRPGIQLAARVVLPRERDPATNAPLTIAVLGEKYSLSGGRWQRLEVRKLPKLVADERQRLRARLNRDVDVSEAYVDALILNVYAGAGTAEMWIDDLELSPVNATDEGIRSEARSKAAPGPTPPPPGVRPIGPAPIEFQREQLRANGRPVLMRGIKHTDTPLRVLRGAGINTVFSDGPMSPAIAEEATRLGMWLVPGASESGTSLAGNDSVLAHYLGEWRSSEELEAIMRAAAAVRAADPQKPIACDVREGFWSYSRHIDLVGAHRWPLFTTLEMARYRDWLVQRRNLCRPSTYLWSWVQTHIPEWYLDVVQPPRNAVGFSAPIGPHPEQIRTMTFLALAAGYRGVAWSSDRALTDASQGQDRLLQIALLNQELAMLEPVLTAATDPPTWIDTSVPQVKAAVFRGERGVLVLPIWIGPGSQFVPEQGASGRVTITVPQVPTGTQAFDVTPGEVKSIAAERVVGGTQITLSDFDTTATIVFTADTSPSGLLVMWQKLVRKLAPEAAQYTYDLANDTLRKVKAVQSELAKLNVSLSDTELLIKLAEERLQSARSSWDAHDYRTAYREAQRAQRPLRVLMRSQWMNLVQGLDSPASSPYGVSYYSLPQHVAFVRRIGAGSPGVNALPEGDFERGTDDPAGWQVIRNTLDEVDLAARITSDATSGKQGLHLESKPRPPAAGQSTPPAPVALERTFLAAESPAVRLIPGSLVRISFQVKIPTPISATADGLVVYDSAAGEALGLRLIGPIPNFKRYTIYRQVPANGELRVVVALTGLGVAVVDDVRIEPLSPPGTTPAP